ncbi:MAG: ATP-dependent zinc metalloprotease FtsH [Mycoplasmataceae bacterium]|nr:MAG: ATP-dependent zinc metalloprotease FtsH [Mycoplasmataceae bacterium]
MREKSLLKKDKKVSSPERWLNLIFIFAFLSGIIIFLFAQFSSPDVVRFQLRKDNDDNKKVIVYGLEENEIDKIDWTKGAIYTEYGWKTKQYRLFGESKNILKKLFGKTAHYDFVTNLEEHEIRNKEIKFEDFPEKKNITIPKTKHKIRHDTFEERERGLKDIIQIIFWLVSIFTSLWFFDMVFGTNFVGIISYPFKGWKKKGELVATPKVEFKDVGGLQEAKEELGEIVSYFQNPQSFWQRGAKVPKGVLLVGPPGNGKTLLAKALAGECRLPFLFRSGSEFEEMMVGLGARRMRELFEQARSYPQGCIVFIDEIDAIGRKRYSANAGHAEQTLNQLLNELDGFHPRENIIILAATNSLKVLDSALLRPGRFDRQIYIPLPNLKGRREIIKLCAQKLPLNHDVDLEEITAMTKGLSGAQIANIFNEASILSIRYNKNFIDYEMIFEAYDRVLMGPSLTSYTLTYEKKKLVAFHEAGHAVVGMSLPETIVKKITIVPRWTAGGYTWVSLYGERDDDDLLNKSQMLAHVMSALGGRASEELIFGSENITMGAYSDFKNASEIVRSLILYYGMSDLGIIPTQESLLYGYGISPELPETTKQKIENEREKIMSQCWKRVKYILKKKKRILDLFAEILIEKNSLQKEDINYIFINQISPYIHLLN